MDPRTRPGSDSRVAVSSPVFRMRRRAGWQAGRLRLRNPGGAGKALETVRLVRQELGNASVQGNNAGERKDAFLSWCDNCASPQLGNHFPATDEVFGEIGESCTGW